MKPRLILVSLGLAVLTMLSFGLQAQEQPKSDAANAAKAAEIIAQQQQLAQNFKEFRDGVFQLKQKLARGSDADKKRAQTLDKVLEECDKVALGNEFAQMNELLKQAKFDTTDGLAKLKAQSDVITGHLTRIMRMIEDDSSDRRAQEIRDLKELVKRLGKVIDEQKMVQVLTDLAKTGTKELEDNQNRVTDKTAKLEKDFGKFLDKDKDGKGAKSGELEKIKGENKEAKGDGKKGEAKDAGKQEKKGPETPKGETKDAGKESKGAKGETKPGADKKDGPASKGKESEPKAGAKSGEKSGDDKKAGSKENKSGEKGKEGAAKENKGGEKTPGKEKDKKEGNAKDSGAKPGEKTNPKDKSDKGAAKGEDKKAGGEPKDSPKSGEAKPGGKPSEGSPKAGAEGDPKAADPKAGDPKSGEAKGGEAKAGEGKGEAKSGSAKSGEAKDGGSPAQAGQPNPQGPQQAKSDGPPPPPSDPKSGSKQEQEVAQTKLKIKEAGFDQKEAEEKIAKGANQQASKNQADAIKKLEDAKKKLERLLKQLREEEQERMLAALQERCEKMLRMQLLVLSGTENEEKAIFKHADKKPAQENKKASSKLSDEENLIVQEANKCIDILQAEGSAVAFAEVFQQVRQDMLHVKKRLELTDVHEVTQGIERDIVDTLKEMIAALKKARDDNKQPPPKDGKPGESGQPGDPKLLELIQELKMVRSLQKRVNDRTEMYGKRFPGKEQTDDPQIVRELRNLSDRQLRIQDIVRKIAQGDNK